MNPVGQRWGEDLARKLIDAKDDGLAVQAIELCGALKIAAIQDSLASLAADKTKSETRRSAALAALPTLDGEKHIDLLSTVLADASEPISLRERVANILGGLNQTSAQNELSKVLAAAPQRLAVGIAMALAGSKTGAEKLLEAVAAWDEGVLRLIQESDELAEYVQRLEAAADDRLQEEVPSGEALAAELERYLREHGGETGRS